MDVTRGLSNFHPTKQTEQQNRQSLPSRVQILPFFEEHLEDFLEWATDDEVTKYLLWNSYSSKSSAQEFLRTVVAKHRWFKAICVDGKVIGSITLDQGCQHRTKIDPLFVIPPVEN